MKKTITVHPEVFILEPLVFGDYRGWFMETWSCAQMEAAGFINCFIQDNQSYTAQEGTLRGIHFQRDPMAQCKLVRVTSGTVLDVAIDLRRGSPWYLNWVAVELSAENKRMLYIPRGFGHGFLTLTNDVNFQYKVDNPYSREEDRSIRFDDPAIGVDWKISNPILSEKDAGAPLLAQSDCNFIYSR